MTRRIKRRARRARLLAVLSAGALAVAGTPGAVALQAEPVPLPGDESDPFEGIPQSSSSGDSPLLLAGQLDRVTSSGLRVSIDDSAVARVDAYVQRDGGEIVPVAWTLTDTLGAFELRLDPADPAPGLDVPAGEVLNLQLLVSDPLNGGFALHVTQVQRVGGDGAEAWELYGPVDQLSEEGGISAADQPNSLVTIPVSVTGSQAPSAAQSSVSSASTLVDSYCRPTGITRMAQAAKIQFTHLMVEDVDRSHWVLSAGVREGKFVTASAQDGSMVSASAGADFPYLSMNFSGSTALTGGTSSSQGSSTDFLVNNVDSRKWGGTLNAKYYTLQPAGQSLYQCRVFLPFYVGPTIWEPAFWSPWIATGLGNSVGTVAEPGYYLSRDAEGQYRSPCSRVSNRVVQPVAEGLEVYRESNASVEYSRGYTFTYSAGVKAAGTGVGYERSTSRTSGRSRNSLSYYSARNPLQWTQYGCTLNGANISQGSAYFVGLGNVEK